MVTVSPETGRTRSRRQAVSESLIDRRFGRFPGWQLNTRPGAEPSKELEVRNSAGQVISSVTGASLGATELDVLCWSLAQAVETTSGRRGEVRTTLTQIARALYGYERKIATSDRRRVVDALTNLWNAEIKLSMYSAEHENAARPDWMVKRRFLQEFQYGPELSALQEGVEVPPEIIGSLRDETLVFQIADWLLERLEDEQWRALLDWPIQRSMGSGMGKRLWVFVETEVGYRPVEPDSPYELLEVELTEDVYLELGAHCKVRADNRKAIKRGLERVLEMDKRYVAEIDANESGCALLPGRGRHPDVLRIVRLRRD